MKRLAVVGLSMFALVSCSGGGGGGGADVTQMAKCQNGTFVLQNENGIMGGQVVPETTWLAHQTVMLMTRVAGGALVCTGALIDTNIVLTAAHCVDQAVFPSSLEVVFSAQPECDSESGKATSERRSVERVVVHPDWGSRADKANRGDLAVLRLSRKAPAAWKPGHLISRFVDPRSQLNLVAGYGSNRGYAVESVLLLRATYLDGLHDSTQRRTQEAFRRRLREAGGSVEDLAKVETFFDMGPDKELIFFDQSEGRGVCSGDSGGASYALFNGRYDITGVASAVMNTDNPDKKASCGMWGVHTSVIYHQKWIEETFQTLRNFESSKKSAFE